MATSFHGKLLLLISLTSFSALFPSVQAQTVGTVSRLSTNAAQQGADGLSLRSSISPNGALIAFESVATNLIEKDTNGSSDIFVKQPSGSAIKRASVGRKGLQANGGATNPSISPQTPNGTYVVVYESDATNLARSKTTPDLNGFQDIYATIFPRPFTFRVSRALSGGLANGRSESPDVALLAEPNRLLVAYASRASNLTTDDANSYSDIFLTKVTAPKDLPTNAKLEDKVQTLRISKSASPGVESNGDSLAPQISGDGNFIVFESQATNLVSGLISSGKQIFLHNVKAGTTTLVSMNAKGEPGNADSRGASINYNGRYITYLSTANNIVQDGKNSSRAVLQVLRFDRETGSTSRVNTSLDGTMGNALPTLVSAARIDASGRFVAFVDRADNLISGDANGTTDVFIKDMITGELSLASRSTGGVAASGASFAPAINREDFTALSGLITFASNAADIVSNDSEGQTDIFQAQLSFAPPPFTADTTLNVPANIALRGRTAKLSLEQFSSFLSSSPVQNLSAGPLRISAASGGDIRYVVSYRRINSDGSRGDLSRLVSKRNSLSLKNLSPGTYTSRYKVQVRDSGRVVSESKPSPSQRFTIE